MREEKGIEKSIPDVKDYKNVNPKDDSNKHTWPTETKGATR